THVSSYQTFVFTNAESTCPAIDNPATHTWMVSIKIRQFPELLINRGSTIRTVRFEQQLAMLENLDVGSFTTQNRLLHVRLGIQRVKLRMKQIRMFRKQFPQKRQNRLVAQD